VRRDTASHEEASASVMAAGTRRLLSALQVPDEVAEAIDGLWRGYLIVPPETLGDTLMIANLMATTPSPFDAAGGKAALSEVDLDHVMNKSEVALVLRKAYDEILSIQQAFNKRSG